MKRILALALVVLPLAACSTTDTSFEKVDGVCYRTRTYKTIGVQTNRQTVQTLATNCGD